MLRKIMTAMMAIVLLLSIQQIPEVVTYIEDNAFTNCTSL